MVRLLPIVCCEICEARLAEQVGLNELRLLRNDIHQRLYRRCIHLLHDGCDGVTVWYIRSDPAQLPPVQPGTVLKKRKAG